MQDQVTQILLECTVENEVVKLPSRELDRALYMATAKKLNFLGGKWKGGKTAGFVFPVGVDVESLLGIAKESKTDLKKESQSFFTPDDLADTMARIVVSKVPNLGCVLEPSAGRGSLVRAIHRNKGDKTIFIGVFENSEVNNTYLSELAKTVSFVREGEDFMTNTMPDECFDGVIANPPFAKNQDIKHTMEMYRLLKKGGIMTVLTSKHWEFGNEAVCAVFREWFEQEEKYGRANRTEIPAGAFKESGTNIETLMLVINKA